jgi:hemoglobin
MIPLSVAALLAACAPMQPARAPALDDGQPSLPAYQGWPKFLSAVQRPDLKQVREIYVNPLGFGAKAGQAYAHGTVFVMENWAARTGADGAPVTGPDGRLIKDRLLKVFVMEKGPGFGAKAPAELSNGDWAYGSYDAAGAKANENFGACRTCHLPMAGKDFVARYDEHFAARR